MTFSLIAFASDRQGVIDTGFIWAAGLWRNRQILDEASTFFRYSGVAFEGRKFTALFAFQYANTRTATTGGIITIVYLYGWNAVVTANRILAEIYLDAVSFSGYSTRILCGRFYIGNDNPL